MAVADYDNRSTSPSSASLNPSASTSIAPTARTDTSAVPLVEAMKGSGLAAIKSPDQPSVLHMYWQDTEGNVLEGDLSTTNLTQLNKNIVVKSSDVKTGTPLSAIVWPSQPFSVSLTIISLVSPTSNGTKLSAYCSTCMLMTLSWPCTRTLIPGCDLTTLSAAPINLLAMELPLLHAPIVRLH